MDSIEAEIVIEKGTLEDADKFFRAATEGDVETIVSMLESGRASVNQTDIDGFTALMIAASQGKTEAVKALLDHGADPDLITLNKENHALFFAAKGGYTDIMDLILRADKDLLDKANNEWDTPLLWACFQGHYDAVRYLVERGAEVWAVDSSDRTTLMGTCMAPSALEATNSPISKEEQEERAKIVRYLIKKAPMLLDIQDCNQTTALHMAACVGNTECVRVLLELGADSTKRNITGMTPLQAARYNNQTECIAILEKKWKELEYEARVNMMKLLELDTKSEERYYGPKRNNNLKKKKKKQRKVNTVKDIGKPKEVIRETEEKEEEKENYICNECDHPSTLHSNKELYKCLVCDDYVLCSDCYKQVNKLHPNHQFQLILKKPTRLTTEVKDVPKEYVIDENDYEDSEWQTAGKKKRKESIVSENTKKGSKQKENNKDTRHKEMNTKRNSVSQQQPTPSPALPPQKAISSSGVSGVSYSSIVKGISKSVTQPEKPNEKEVSESVQETTTVSDPVQETITVSEPVQETTTVTEPQFSTAVASEEPSTTKTETTENQSLPYPTATTDINSTYLPTNCTIPNQSASLYESMSMYSTPKDYYSYPNAPANELYSYGYEEDLKMYGNMVPPMDSSILPNAAVLSTPLAAGNAMADPQSGSTMSMSNPTSMQTSAMDPSLQSLHENSAMNDSSYYSGPPGYANYWDYTSQYNPYSISGYTVEELQRALDFTSPTAAAYNITIPHVLGLELDVLSQRQLDILMDIHINAIRQLTEAKMRRARMQERERFMYNDYYMYDEMNYSSMPSNTAFNNSPSTDGLQNTQSAPTDPTNRSETMGNMM